MRHYIRAVISISTLKCIPDHNMTAISNKSITPLISLVNGIREFPLNIMSSSGLAQYSPVSMNIHTHGSGVSLWSKLALFITIFLLHFINNLEKIKSLIQHLILLFYISGTYVGVDRSYINCCH